MSDLVDLLTQAFEQAPRRPADAALPGGVTALAYWSFAPSLEVVVAGADRPPADGVALRAWRTRLDRRPIPLVLLIESVGNPLLVGPAGDPPPMMTLDARLVADELVAASALDPLDVRRKLPEAWERARGAGGLGGLRNVGLFSAHYLRVRAPKLRDWEGLTEVGRAASRGQSLPARLDAPMAGGPSTPALAAAVSAAGGLGFFAAGYRDAGDTAEAIGDVRRRTSAPFGVNVFVPGDPAVNREAIGDYVEQLRRESARYGVPVGQPR